MCTTSTGKGSLSGLSGFTAGGSAKPQATSSAVPSPRVVSVPAPAIQTNGTQKITAAAATTRARRRREISARAVRSSSARPARKARPSRMKMSMRWLCAVLNPGSWVTAQNTGSIPTISIAVSTPNTAMATRPAVGRMIRAAEASMRVSAPAYQPRTCMNGSTFDCWVARPQ